MDRATVIRFIIILLIAATADAATIGTLHVSRAQVGPLNIGTNLTTLTNLVTDGDSITIGDGIYPVWPAFMRTNVGLSVLNVENIAVSGQTYENMNSDPLQTGRLYGNQAAANILFLWDSNDVKLDAPTNTIWSRISQCVSNGQRMGFSVYMGTLMDRTDFNTDARKLSRTNINARIRAEAVYSLGVIKVVDFTTNALLDVNITPSSFYDGVHPSNFGHRVIATNVQSVLFP